MKRHTKKSHIVGISLVVVLLVVSLPAFLWSSSSPHQREVEPQAGQVESAQRFEEFEAQEGAYFEPESASSNQGETIIETSENCRNDTESDQQESENSVSSSSHITVECVESTDSQDTKVHIESRTHQSSQSSGGGSAHNSNSTSIDVNVGQ